MGIAKEAAYKTLDIVTFGRGVPREIGGEKFRFPAKFSRYYEANYEPETFRFLRSRLQPGDVAIDVGGHIGLFAVLAARLVGPRGKVFSFEPTPFTRSVLEKVVELNGCSDTVEVRPEAVSSQRGSTVFYDTGTEISNANSLVRTGLSRSEIPIELISLDEFAAERGITVNCIKIDAEGAEYDVLLGAKRILTEDRPYVRLGLHPPFIAEKGDSLEQIWDLIAECGYSVEFNGESYDKMQFCSNAELFDVNLIPSS